MVTVKSSMNTKVVLEGSLAFINLGDILQLLSTDNRTGILRILSPHFKEPGMIFVKNGNPIDAIASDQKGIEAMYSLFGWLSGRFEFIHEDVKRKDCINKRMMAIVLDGLRVLDEGGVKKFCDDEASSEVSRSNHAQNAFAAIKGPFVEYSSVVDEDEYPDESTIVTQGRHGNWLWVVLEGLVDIVKKTDMGQAVVSTVGPGGFIGGLTTLLHPENSRSATAVSRGPVQLGVIDTQQLSSELSLIDPEFKKVLLSLENRLRKVSSRYTDIVSGADKFAGLPLNVQAMISQGDDVQKVFTIISGEAYVVKKSKAGMIYLITLGSGDFIGKIPFLDIDHEPESASVYASDDLKLSIIDMEKMNEEYNKLSVTIKNIIEYTTICVSATTSKACA